MDDVLTSIEGEIVEACWCASGGGAGVFFGGGVKGYGWEGVGTATACDG